MKARKKKQLGVKKAKRVFISTALSASMLVTLFPMGMNGVQAAPEAAGHTYYVNGTAGNDSGSGAQDSPWKTIGKAAEAAQPGDSVIIAGGTYRETVDITTKGTETAPVTFKAAEGEDVLITGTDLIDGFRPESQDGGPIYVADVSLAEGMTADELQLFENGNVMWEARWPNVDADDTIMFPTLAMMKEGTIYAGNEATIVDNELLDVDYTGTKIWALGGLKWIAWTADVTGYDSATKSIGINGLIGGNAYDPVPGNEYYLYGSKGLLDADGEWWYDEANQKLYVYSSDGTPEGIEIKNRKVGMKLTGASSVKVQDINFEGCTVIMDAESSDNELDGIHATYISHKNNYKKGSEVPPYGGRGIEICGTNNILKNSTLQYTSNSMVYMEGNGNQLINNYLSDGGYIASWNGMVYMNGANLVVSHNTITNAARTGIYFEKVGRMKDCLIQYNDVSNAGVLTADTAGIYMVNVDGGGTEIRYNKVHDITCTTGMGIYLDNATSNFLVHHNVVWNTVNPYWFNVPSNNNLMFNNTGAKVTGDELNQTGSAFAKDVTGDKFFNNVIGISKGSGFIVEETANIWNATSDMFVDQENNDFRLKEGAIAIDNGVSISGITGNMTGEAPDCGAYEFGEEDFKVGCDFDNPPVVDYERVKTGYETKVEDGTFSWGLDKWETQGTVEEVQENAWFNENANVRNQGKGVKLGGESKISQTITGLEPNTEYELSGWFKHAQEDGSTVMSIAGYGGEPLTVEAKDTSWKQQAIRFTTGAENTTAEISVENMTKDGEGGEIQEVTKTFLTNVKELVGEQKTEIPLGEEGKSYIEKELNGDGKASIRIEGEAGSYGQLRYKENCPTLIITTDSGIYHVPLAKYAITKGTDGVDNKWPDAYSLVGPSNYVYWMFDLASSGVTGKVQNVVLGVFPGYIRVADFNFYTYDYDGWSADSITWENQDTFREGASTAVAVFVDDIFLFKPYKATDEEALKKVILNAEEKLAMAGDIIEESTKETFRNEIEKARNDVDKVAAKEFLEQRTEIFVKRLELEQILAETQKNVDDAASKGNPDLVASAKNRFDETMNELKGILNSDSTTKELLEESKVKATETGNQFIMSILPKISEYETVDMGEVLKDSVNWVGGEITDNGDGSYNFAPGKISQYNEMKYKNVVFEFDWNYETNMGYPGFILRAQQEAPKFNANNYFMIYKENSFEAQKYVNGSCKENGGYLKTFANGTPEGRLMRPGETQKIQLGVVETELGMRVFMYVDGKAAFDYLDTTSNAEPDGYFAVATTGATSGTFTMMPSSTWVVSFETNGGQRMDAVLVKKGETVKPEIPVREGYSFVGWFTDVELENEFNSEDPITANMTLYAKWEKNEDSDKPEEPENPQEPQEPQDPDTPSNPENPKEDPNGSGAVQTGDTTPVIPMLVCMILVGVVAVICSRKKMR